MSTIRTQGTLRGFPNTLVPARAHTLTELKTHLAEAASLFDAPAESRPVESRMGYGADGEQMPFCEEHGQPFHKQTKNGQVWFSHRLLNGKWCRYNDKVK